MEEGKIRYDFDLQSLYEGSWKVALSDVATSISFEALAKLNDFLLKIKYSPLARIIFKPVWALAILPINQTVHITYIDHVINLAGSGHSGKRGKRHDNIRLSLNPTFGQGTLKRALPQAVNGKLKIALRTYSFLTNSKFLFIY